MTTPRHEQYDVVIVGAGHNGLVAAAYLAGAGLSVLILERADRVGGAMRSEPRFPGVDVRLSPYAYLVSLLPQQIIDDLRLPVSLAPRPVAAYCPTLRNGHPQGLLIAQGDASAATAASFEEITGSAKEYERYRSFTDDLQRLAAALAPSLLEPLPLRSELRRRVDDDALWESLVERPLSEMLETRFNDDLVRGLLLTDGLIGTFVRADEPSRDQNACFLYHAIGHAIGGQRVPVGGMGAVAEALHRAARQAGAEIVTGAEVVAMATDGRQGEVTVQLLDGEPQRISARWLLSNVAPRTLATLLGEAPPGDDLPGCQVKIDLVLRRLPTFRSGLDATQGFAGTVHIDEGYGQLARAYDQAGSGLLPDILPTELRCHTLTDPSILTPSLAALGWHTLSAFVLHTPIGLFTGDDPISNDAVLDAFFAGVNAHLAEPLQDCVARDANDKACIEVANPLDLQEALGIPGGNIFHGRLQFPFREDHDLLPDPPAGGPPAPGWRWGVDTAHDNVLLCGSGARRGGAVNGVAGHNAARAVLDATAAGTARRGG